jgi:hypothetical protein
LIGFFISSKRNDCSRTPCKISALSDKRFWSYGHFKWLKRGIFAVFWVKIQNQLSGNNWLFFCISSERNIFSRTPCKISALTDKRFWSYGRFKRLKIGIFAVFYFKIQNQLSKHIWLIFFISSERKVFLWPQAKFQPSWTNGFEVRAVLSGQKEVYLLFLGSKFKINYMGVFDWIFLYEVKKYFF